LSRIRTDEHLGPQDGKMRLQLERENLDIRVSIVPVAEGEKVVLRLLSAKSRQYSLVDLGINPTDLIKINRALDRPYGMILSTGPTGSGKTTSIYAMLKILNTRDRNITTIEDPLEYRIAGVNQIQVNTRTNLTFASGLRSILRQDPNIIFVGEIRDNDAAAIAVNAALTGHLVLSTLHTNDAATSLPRLLDMEIEPFLVASTVNIVIGQRLVRQICHKCKKSYTLTSSELSKNLSPEVIKRHFKNDKTITFYKGDGCKSCHFTGYSGRIGIFEVMEISRSIRDLISKRSDSSIIAAQAIKEGMSTMMDDGLSKCKLGLTTLEEILSVTKLESL
jgi:type IV pilus assembly protein PilB